MPIRRRRFQALPSLILAAIAVAGTHPAEPPPSVPAMHPADGPYVAPAPAPASAMDKLAGVPAPGDLHVMTYNLRYARTVEPNSWKQRRPVMRTLLTTERPDLIGTQEGLANQLRAVESDLGAGYDYIGRGRNGGSRGEHMAIFFRKDRLTPQASGHFWLSGTPSVPGSNTWGGNSIRMVTWVRFLDRATGKRFYAVNTHLDNASENARRRSARLIRKRLASFGALPIVLTGDFNTPARSSYPYDLLVDQAGYRDTWTSARLHGPVYGTFQDFGPLKRDGARIDWILTSPGVTALATLINTHRRGSQYASDHFPVQARLRLP